MSKTINSKQIKFDEKPIPKVNQTCMFFDDGKISYSRMYQATVKQVMVYDDAPDKVKKAFERESKTHDWIWNNTTDYIIACDIKKINYENVLLGLHELFPTVKEEIIKNILKDAFKNWLDKYPTLAEKCPKISLMAVLKVFAKRFA